MKQFTAILLALLLFAVALFGCAQANPAESGKKSIVCTIFPQYDWVRQILGEQAGEFNITLLLNSRADLHNYQPSVDDIVKISTCDLFVYVGGESDGWVSNALAQAVNPDMIVINLLEVLGDAAKEEELLPGMEAEDEGEEEEAYDEHVWLSLQNAARFCGAIYMAICELDPERPAYLRNMMEYTNKLEALDAAYHSAVDAAAIKTLLFGDRFPFRYLTDDYGLEAFAAFPGCSAETEASFNTIADLAKKVDELKLHTVMVTESADQSIARTIIGNTAGKNQQILVLDAIQSVTMGDVQGGTTYLSIMESNLAVLKQALK